MLPNCCFLQIWVKLIALPDTRTMYPHTQQSYIPKLSMVNEAHCHTVYSYKNETCFLK